MAGVERAYREAVKEMPYSSVSVTMLCAEAGIARKSFYKRFSGKNDVLRAIFERDVMRPQIELIELLTFKKMSQRFDKLELRMFQAVYDDREFYSNVVNCDRGGRGAFLYTTSEAFREFNIRMMRKYGFQGDEWQVDYASECFAESKAHYLTKWIEGGLSLSPSEAAEFYQRIALPSWRALG